MALSSVSKPTLSQVPPGVDPDELYDGPDPASLVTPIPAQAPRSPLQFVPVPGGDPEPTKIAPGYPAVLSAALDVLSARILLLIAVIGAVVIFGYSVYDPVPWRTGTAIAYALVVLLPLVVLFYRRG